MFLRVPAAALVVKTARAVGGSTGLVTSGCWPLVVVSCDEGIIIYTSNKKNVYKNQEEVGMTKL